MFPVREFIAGTGSRTKTTDTVYSGREPMKYRTTAGIVVLLVSAAAGIVAGVGLYTAYSTKASVPAAAAGVELLPLDCDFIFGINVKKFSASPAYERISRSRSFIVADRLAEFIEKTGVDPAKDISGLIGAGNPGMNAGEGSAVIASGSFIRDTIEDRLRSVFDAYEMEYGEAVVLIVPEEEGGKSGRGILFLDENAIAFGDVGYLKKIVDVREQRVKGMTSNPEMMVLVEMVVPGDMFWFAGNAAGLLTMASLEIPLGQGGESIRNVLGAVDVGEDITGKIIAQAVDASSAEELTAATRGMIVFGMLAAEDNSDMRMLLEGMNVARHADQVSIDFSFPLKVYDRLAKLLSQ
jgi:hypothetical protein